MAEKIEVGPTPIQRNRLDVATELTQLHFRNLRANNVEEIQQAFTHLYALVRTLESMYGEDLAKFVPEEIASLYLARH